MTPTTPPDHELIASVRLAVRDELDKFSVKFVPIDIFHEWTKRISSLEAIVQRIVWVIILAVLGAFLYKTGLHGS